MNHDLKAALDEYARVMESSFHMDVYDAALREAKAWQRCAILGATREDQTEARERVGR